MLQPGAPLADPLEPYAQVDRTRPDGGGWVMAHLVGGLDGSAAIGGRVGDLSTAPDAELFLLMRALADLVLVGAAGPAHEMADVLIAGAERVDPGQAVAGLAALGHRVVLCEGGPTWLGELVAAGRLDELCLTISPLMGGDPLPVSVAPPGAPLARFAKRHVLRGGDTLFLRYERGDDE